MRRLLPLAAAGFIVASLLIYLFGDSGLVSYKRLDDYRQGLAANVEKLKEKNARLASELSLLRQDPERNLLMAREIGLYRAEDEVVRLEGLPRPTSTYEVGDLVKLRKSKAERSAIVKAVAIGVTGLLASVVVITRRIGRRRSNGGTRFGL